MKRTIRTILLLLASAIFFSAAGCFPSARDGNGDGSTRPDGDGETTGAPSDGDPGKGSASAPTGLRVDLREAPLGLDNKDPAFSWIMNDPDRDEIQTAFRVVISKTSALPGDLLDTGWIESRSNTGVHLSGISGLLSENSLYFWQVATRDRAGNESELSEPSCFMTGIGSEWQSTRGIWPAVDEAAYSDYVIEQKMSIATGGALALLAYMDVGAKNGYMLQIRNADNIVKFHRITDGTINTTNFAALDLSAAGITLPADSAPFGVRVTFNGADIAFEFDTGSGYADAGSVNVTAKGNITSGTFGYRTGRFESGTIDDLTVKTIDGEIIYSSDFSVKDSRFGSLTAQSGKLAVPVSAYSCFAFDEGSGPANYAFFRSPSLEIDPSKVEKAVISLAARGSSADRAMIADLYFNGISLGVGSARELTNAGGFVGAAGYTKVYYNSYDATPYIKNGKNIIAVAANCLDQNRGVLVQMTLFNKDGTSEIITNSGSEGSGWKAQDGSSAFGDSGATISTGLVRILHDNVDMNSYPAGWSGVDFDDSSWKDATATVKVADYTKGTRGRVLVAYPSENVVRVITAQPEAKTYIGRQGTLIVDLGKEIIGGLHVELDLPEAAVVKVRRGEELSSDGSVKYQLTAGPAYEDVWTLKKGKNAFDTLTMRNFRYVELIGLTDSAVSAIVSQAGVTGYAMMQPFDESASSFTATDNSPAATLLNRLYELSKYTIKATDQDVYVDSQARERLPYEGDLLVNANTSYAVSGNYSLARHSNEWLIDNPTWPNDYSLFIVETAYRDLLYTGDANSVTEYFEALKKKLTVNVQSTDPGTGLIRAKDSTAGNGALIDWPLSERDGYTASTYDVVFNSEYVGIYNIMADVCDFIGRGAEAEEYRAMSDLLKKSLIQIAYDSENGRFADSIRSDLKAVDHYSVHATAYALAYGVYDSQEMADAMCEYVYCRCREQFVGSIYATYFILRGLYNGGHGEMAEALLTNPGVGVDIKTFASILDDLNCTISPEAWGHKWKANMTLSHPWGAAPGCSIVQGMFGIEPTSPGFYTFDIKLQPGNIRSAELITPTVQGTVALSFEIKDGILTAAVTVPVNTTATVRLPSADSADGITVNGKAVGAKRDGAFLCVTLGSGSYTIKTAGC